MRRLMSRAAAVWLGAFFLWMGYLAVRIAVGHGERMVTRTDIFITLALFAPFAIVGFIALAHIVRDLWQEGGA